MNLIQKCMAWITLAVQHLPNVHHATENTTTNKDIFNYPGNKAHNKNKRKPEQTGYLFGAGLEINLWTRISSVAVFTDCTLLPAMPWKTGTYKLIRACERTSKAQVVLSFLYNSKNTKKEPRKINYARWIPSENVLITIIPYHPTTAADKSTV